MKNKFRANQLGFSRFASSLIGGMLLTAGLVCSDVSAVTGLSASTKSRVDTTSNKKGSNFIAFESGPVRPLALAEGGKHLFVTNIPDNRLEVFSIRHKVPKPVASVSVGLEPVSVALLSDHTAFVANHLSDSVSVVDIRNPRRPQVIKTLLVGDEPRDLLITDPDGNGPLAPRLFVTTAHRGQHRSHPSIAEVPGAGDPQFNTPSVGRADVWVFDTSNLGKALGGKPISILSFFADTPRALAVSNDGKTVYVASHFSQNRSAIVAEGVVCDGFESAEPCPTLDGIGSPNGPRSPEGVPYLPGGNPGPAMNVEGFAAPEVGLIVRFDPQAGPSDNDLNTGRFVDELGRDWTNGLRMTMPDKDVFALDASSLQEIAFHQSVGTTLFNMAVNPVSGALYVSNTEAQNQRRFEGPGTIAGTVRGHLAETSITVIKTPNQYLPSGENVQRHHLNPHIDYDDPAPGLSVNTKSLATPTEMVVSKDGTQLFVAAFGSQALGVVNTQALERGAFIPGDETQIPLSQGGPAGLVLSEDGRTIYTYTRFDNGISVVDVTSKKETHHLALFNPEPAHIVNGRPFLYDARLSSANGEASCSSCHIFGDDDSLAWDLGVPEGGVSNSSIRTRMQDFFELQVAVQGADDPSLVEALDAVNGGAGINQFHPMKGPMTTQTLRGLATHGAMHWRGDRVSGIFSDDATKPTQEDASDENLSFINFSAAFEGLNGRSEILPREQMQQFADFMLDVYLPPNPVRNLDNSLNEIQQRGKDFYMGLDQVVTLADGSQITAKRRSDFFSEAVESLISDSFGVEVEAGFTCEGCHRLDPAQGFFGTDGQQSFDGEPQILKVPHLRNLVRKVGAFGHVSEPGINVLNISDPTKLDFQGDQIRGFGFLRDGSADTLNNFFHATIFSSNTFGGDTGFQTTEQRDDVEQFVLAFPGDLAPVVGQQVTINKNSQGDSDARLAMLLTRSQIPFTSLRLGGDTVEADIVAKCSRFYRERGFLHLGAEVFLNDRGFKIYGVDRLKRYCRHQPITFTAVPPGSGRRIAIDRDEDAILDGWDFRI